MSSEKFGLNRISLPYNPGFPRELPESRFFPHMYPEKTEGVI